MFSNFYLFLINTDKSQSELIIFSYLSQKGYHITKVDFFYKILKLDTGENNIAIVLILLESNLKLYVCFVSNLVLEFNLYGLLIPLLVKID